MAASFNKYLLRIYLKAGTVLEAEKGVENQRDKVSGLWRFNSSVLQILWKSMKQSFQEVSAVIISHLLFLFCFGAGSYILIRSDTDPRAEIVSLPPKCTSSEVHRILTLPLICCVLGKLNLSLSQ